MARIGQVTPSRVGIFVGAGLRGMDVRAFPEAAIIKNKNIDSQLMPVRQSRNCIRNGTGAVMQKEQGIGGVGCIALGGNPPAGKLENSGFSCVESNLVVLEAGCGRSGGDGAVWVE